jgi:hypothetical protein
MFIVRAESVCKIDWSGRIRRRTKEVIGALNNVIRALGDKKMGGR